MEQDVATPDVIVALSRRAERALRGARDELEFHADQGSAEFPKANQGSQAKIAEGERTETKIEHLDAGLRAIRSLNQLVLTERVQVEKALAHERDLLQCLMNNTSDYIYFKDDACRFTRINRAHAELLGLGDPEEAVGKTDLDFFPEEAAQRYLVRDQEILTTRQPVIDKVDVVRGADGRDRWMSTSKLPIIDDAGKVTGLVGISRDITKRVRAEQALRKSEEGYRQLVENATDIIYEMDDSGHLTFVNALAVRVTGYSEKELIGKHYLDLIRPDYRLDVERFYRSQFVRKIQNTYYELPAVTRDGTTLWLGQNVHLVTKAGRPLRPTRSARSERIVGFQAVARDITERVGVVRALRRSEERFRGLVENAHDLVYTHDLEGNFTSANPAAMRTYGYTTEEIFQLNIAQIVDPEYLPLVQQKIREMLEGSPQTGPYELLTHSKEGEPIWVEVSTHLLEREGQPVEVQCIARDITERVRAEEELWESEERYYSLFNHVPIGLYRTTPAGEIVDANPALVKMLGYPDQKSLLAVNVADVYVDPEVRRREQALLEHEGVVRRFEAQIRRYDGTVIWTWDTCRAVRDAQSRVLYYEGSLEDITEQVRAEEEIQRRNQELTILNALGGVIGSSLRLSEVLAALESQMIESGLGNGMLLSYDQSKDQLSLETAWGMPATMLSALQTVHAREFWGERAIRKKEPCLGQCPCNISDRSEATACRVPADKNLASLAAEGFRSWVCMPLLERSRFQGLRESGSEVGRPFRSDGSASGVLCLFGRESTTFSGNQTAFFKAMGRQVGAAIHNARLHEQLRIQHARLQELSRRVVEVQENERRYIARELHDQAAQLLVALQVGLRSLQTKALEGRADCAKEVVQRVATLRDVVDEVLEDLHRLTEDLRPISLHRSGLVAALRQHVEAFGRKYDLIAEFEALGFEDAHSDRNGLLSSAIEISVYRIVQEALTNVARHAQAQWVIVLLERREDRMVVVVEDNGIGFDVTASEAADLQSEAAGNLGLVGMRERAELLGGTLTIESDIGKGTSVILEAPCLFAS